MSTAPPKLEPSRAGENASPLGRNSLNAPNIITLSRLGLAIVLFVLIDINGWWRAATAVFIVAATTDFLDGYIARKYGLVTVLGRILDPFVDKIIICGAFVFLQKWPESGVTAWITFIIVAREMFITSLRAFLEQRGQDFSAKWSGKLKMVLQCVAVPACLLSLSPEFIAWLAPHVSPAGFVTLRNACLLTAVFATVYSGIEYTWRGPNALLRGNQCGGELTSLGPADRNGPGRTPSMNTNARAPDGSSSSGMRPLLLGLLAVAVALSVVGWLTQPESPPSPIDGIEVTLTEQNFQQEVLDYKGCALVDFWFEACPPCRRMKPVVAHLSVNYRDRVKVGKLDIDEHGQVAARYGLEAFPVLLLFRNGDLIARWEGYGGLQEMSRWLDDHLEAQPVSGTARRQRPLQEIQQVAATD